MAKDILKIKTCKKCGCEFTGSACKPCRRLYDIAYNKANAARFSDKKKEYRAKNADAINARSAAWYLANSERVKLNVLAYRANNPDKVKAWISAWQAANRKKLNAKQSANYAKNPDGARASYRKWAVANLADWRAKNREKPRIYRNNRRARAIENGGKLSPGIANKLLKLQRGKCACCGNPLGDDYHIDHVMPLALGGANTDDNMQLLRKQCNLQKRAKHPIDFMQSRGFLL